MAIIKCLCGCNTEINKYDNRGRIKRYAIGHINKGKSNYWSRKDVIKGRTAHGRAVKICKPIKCFVDNIQCKGKLHIHHIDSNPFNNNKENLVCLCDSHHKLMHKRKYNLIQLNRLFDYYIDRSGKRRYSKMDS